MGESSMRAMERGSMAGVADPQGAASPSPKVPARVASSPPVQVRAGDLARMFDFGGQGYLAVVLPDGQNLALNGALVRVLDVLDDRDGVGGLIVFRPEPWTFDEAAWPCAWQASADYFVRVEK